MAEISEMVDKLRVLFGNLPYFEGATEGLQMPMRRGLLLTALVSLVARPNKPVHVLEVGSWIGFSALTWAEAIDKFTPAGGDVLCVDLWEPYFADNELRTGKDRYLRMDAMARSGLAYALFQHNVGCAPEAVPIRHRRGASGSVLPTLPPASFDIVYLDASHYYEAAAADIRAAKPLVAEGGILCGDDLELQAGRDVDEAEARANMARDFVASAQGRHYHPGVTLAVAEELGPVSALVGTWFMRRRGNIFEAIDLTPARVMLPRSWPPHLVDEARRFLQSMKASATE